MAGKQKLTTVDWIKAAFRALTIGGPQAIKAEAIARDLKVSKGSFYWHFKDVADLKAKMLSHWQQVATLAVIAVVDERSDSAIDQLRLLVEMATDGKQVAYGGEKAEAAIRDWARYDSKVRAVLTEVDRQRMAYVEQLFTVYHGDEIRSKRDATALYAGLIGLQRLEHTGNVDLQKDLMFLLEKLMPERPANKRGA